jgi:ectoine hydroxylase-related dioxygenase (phytanoyl-CoA dioxygenase family)
MSSLASTSAGELLALTPEQKRFFDENGYLLLEDLYSPEEVAAMHREMAVLLRDPDRARPRVKFSYEPEAERERHPIDPDNPRRVWMVMDTPLAGDFWYHNFRDPRVVDVIVDLLGPNIDFHNGKARIKPPGYQSHQGWHQDWPYERHSRPELAAAILYLDDTAPGAAATYVVPGSHRQGEWEHDGHNIIPDARVGTPGVPLCARAGSVAFVHVLVVHRASSNETNRNRSAIINEYKTHEALDLWGNPCAFADMPLRRNRLPV